MLPCRFPTDPKLRPSFAWIWLNSSSWMWDQAMYADQSVRLLIALKSQWTAWLGFMVRVGAGRAPGLIWVGQFFAGLYKILGSIERSLLLSIFLAQTITVWLIYDTCRRLREGDRLSGAVAAAFTAAAPLFIGVGHQYFVETFQLAAVAWMWHLAVVSKEVSRLDLFIRIALALVAGMATKVSTPLFVGPPLALAFLGSFGLIAPRPSVLKTSKPSARVALIILLVVTAGFTFIWYAINTPYLIGHLAMASGKGAVFWGSSDSFFTKFGRWLGFLKICFFPGPLYLAAILILVTGFLLRFKKSSLDRHADL